MTVGIEKIIHKKVSWSVSTLKPMAVKLVGQ